MDVTLTVLAGKNAGKEIAVTVPEFIIGRADHCHLRPHSGLVSRQHCVLLSREGSVAVRDLGSQNGTFVNGARIAAEHPLKTGDKLSVGQLEFEVLLSSHVGGKRRPIVADVRDAAMRTTKVERTNDSDIASWLSAEIKANLAHETQAIDDSDTNEIVMTDPLPAGTSGPPARASETMVPAHGDPEAETTPPPPHSPKKAADKRKPDKKSVGKLPPKPPDGPPPENSGQAAAEVLKKFFKGR